MADKKGAEVIAFYSYLTSDGSGSSAPLLPVSQPMSKRRTYDKYSGSRPIRHAGYSHLLRIISPPQRLPDHVQTLFLGHLQTNKTFVGSSKN